MIIALKKKKYVPTGLSFIFDKIMAIISNPPVEAPHFKAIPTPIAEIIPPKIAFNMISFETALTGMISKNRVINITQRKLKKVKAFPTFFHAKITTGILNKLNNTPVDM